MMSINGAYDVNGYNGIISLSRFSSTVPKALDGQLQGSKSAFGTLIPKYLPEAACTLSPVFPYIIRLAILLALVVSLLPPTRTARAASFTVNSLVDVIANDGFCTLREAIQEANNDADTDCPGSPSPAADTITFSVSGTITLGSTLPNIVDAPTAGALTIDGGGHITISGDNLVQVMWVNSGANLTLQNLTIADGYTLGVGGGIDNDSGALTVTDSTFSNNSADYGGGIDNDSGALTVTDSTFSNNSADYGGGIYNYNGALTVTDSAFSNNSADEDGGGIENYDTLTVTDSTFSGNSAGAAGSGEGLHVDGGAVTLRNTLIANSVNGRDCVTAVTLSAANNNLIEDSANACGLTHGSSGNIIGFDPNLGALTGSPAYFPLNMGSLAIDAGDNATCANPPVNNQSQNGVTRPQDGDGDSVAVCDIGSYEHPSSPPVVASHSLQPSYIGAGPASFTVTFNMPVADPPGDTLTDDVTNPANYLLIEKGPNAAADTVSCLGGVSGDDVQQTVTAVSYNNATFTSTVTLTGALPAGNYRLFVCGTTSIVNADDVPLNNGADFTFDFVVAQAAASLPATGFPMGRVTQLGIQPAGHPARRKSLRPEQPVAGNPQTGRQDGHRRRAAGERRMGRLLAGAERRLAGRQRLPPPGAATRC